MWQARVVVQQVLHDSGAVRIADEGSRVAAKPLPESGLHAKRA